MTNEINNEVSNNEVSNQVVEINEFDSVRGLKFNIDSFRMLIDIVQKQNDRIAALESKNQTSSTKREMTEADARIVLQDETIRAMSHKNAAEHLGLTYGQVYSARIGATFKAVFKETKELKLSVWEPKAK